MLHELFYYACVGFIVIFDPVSYLSTKIIVFIFVNTHQHVDVAVTLLLLEYFLHLLFIVLVELLWLKINDWVFDYKTTVIKFFVVFDQSLF